MTERLDPTRPYGDRRQYRRRDEDQPAPRAAPPEAGLPAVAAPVHAHEYSSIPPLDGQAAFAAQLLGQPGEKRGLRGGPAVIDAARSAYLEAEYSGPADRRPRKGLFKKAEI
jgi:hypothetical protein